MAQPVVKTSFASGEWAPKLRSRVDITKYHAGAALLRNFYVDYSGGGASTRQGTKFLAAVGTPTAPVRLIKFQPSANTSYVLEFGNFYIRFYTNGAQVLSGGLPYQIASPFAASDLFPNPITGNPGIKVVQDVTSMIICHPSYPPQILTVISATNWTITAINFASTIGTPTNLSLTSTDTPGTTWEYAYLVTAVDANNQESAAPTPATFAGTNYIGDTANKLANTLSWTAVAGAASYNIYKASPTFKAAVPASAQFGFIANQTGTTFIDSFPGIAPDFAQTPPIVQNPFSGASVASYTVTVNGVYTTVPTVSVTGGGGTGATAQASLGVTVVAINNHGSGGNDVTTLNAATPVGALLTFANGVVLQIATATNLIGAHWTVNSVTIFAAGSITSGSTPSNPTVPTGFTSPIVAYSDTGPPNLAFNFTWGVTAVNGINNGAAYTSAPSVAFSSGAAAATAILGSASGGNPGVPGFFQERLCLAGLTNAPQQFNFSQPGSFFNFNTTFPTEADDAIQASIIAEDLNSIRSLVDVPTGILALTNKAGWLVNGGGGISTAVPITPADVTAQPQAYNGANDLQPLKINFDILYGTYKGNYVRDLTYNIYANIFSGSDITVLANHLFFGHYLVQWTWAEEPFKTVWAVRDDGVLLSLGYVKEQDLIGWAHHDTNGSFLSVTSVVETVNGNVVDAVYCVVSRFINGATQVNVERFADRYFPFGYEDSWSVDCALQTAPQVTSTNTLTFQGNATVLGNPIVIQDTVGAPFTATMATNHWIIRSGGGIYKINVFTSSTSVTASVVRTPSYINQYTGTPVADPRGYTIWQPVTTVTGLTQLIGATVTGVADGAVVTPTVVSGGGSVTLATAATKVTLGLAFTPQLQTLPIDTGEPTIQGKRKKLPAATLRVADTLGLQIGTQFANVVAMKDLVIGNTPSTSNGIVTVTDLFSGDARTVLDQVWQEIGQICIQQGSPYPATVLGVFPELAPGDTK